MLGHDTVEEAVRSAGIEVPPVYLEETRSTQAEAGALADVGAPEWAIVVAAHQTAGRGRLGRGWASAPGKALQFSLVLRPALAPQEAAVISLLAAAEMAAACREVAGVEVRSKWPNDLVAGDRKLGGILLEARVEEGSLRSLVLGVGVNVSMEERDFPEAIRGGASSLVLEGGRVDPESLLEEFLRRFRQSYRPAEKGFTKDAVRRYRSICVTIGRAVRATVLDGRTVEGRAEALDEGGGLVLEAGGRRVTVAFGEVFHLE